MKRRPIESLEARRLFAAVSFAAATAVDAFTPVSRVAAGYVDGDRNLDLVSTGGGLLETSFGDGAGGLTTRGGASPPGVVGGLTLGDVNDDGYPDVITATSAAATAGNIQSYLTGGATLTFAAGNAGSTSAAPPSPASAVAADFNADGRTDLAVAYPQSRLISIYLGTGGGSFSPPVQLSAAGRPNVVVVADLNDDGSPDVIALESDVNQFEVFLGSSTGAFSAGRQFLTAPGPTGLAVGDLNGDGRADLIVSVNTGVQTFLNRPESAGYPFDAAIESAGNGPVSPVIADVNFDGVPDVVVADSESNTLSVLTGLPDGSLNAPVTIPGPAHPTAVAAVDLDNDGLPDLVVANGSTQIFTLINTALSSGPMSSRVTLTAPPIVNTGVAFDVSAAVTWPAGYVTFYDGGQVIGTAAVDSFYKATASLTVSTSGTHHLSAVFTGDAAHAPAVSDTVDISASPVVGPYLYATIVSATPAYSAGAGNTNALVVRVSNRGPVRAVGTITLTGSAAEYYTYRTTYRDVVTVATTNLASVPLSLDPGQSTDVAGTVSIPVSKYANGYRLTVAISPLTGFAADNIGGGDTVLGQPLYSVDHPPAGSVIDTTTASAKVKLSTGAVVSLKLKGYGSGGLVDGGNGTVAMRLTGTTAATVATLSVARGTATVSSILIASEALGSLIAPRLNFDGANDLPGTLTRLSFAAATGSLYVPSIVPLTATFGAATNFQFSDLGPMGSLSATSWSGGIAAEHIGKLFVRGTFSGNVLLSGADSTGTSIENATVGSIGPGVWSMPGRFGSLSVAKSVAAGFSGDIGGPVGPVRIRGDFLGNLAASSIDVFHVDGGVASAFVLAGTSFGSDHLLGGGDDSTAAGTVKSVYVGKSVRSSVIGAGLNPVDQIYRNGDDALIPGGRIGRTIVRGVLTDDSAIVAAALPVTISVAGVPVKTLTDERFR